MKLKHSLVGPAVLMIGSCFTLSAISLATSPKPQPQPVLFQVDEDLEPAVQVVTGDLAQNELYIFGEADTIPASVLSDHPTAEIAIFGGDEKIANEKMMAFNGTAQLVSERIAKEAATTVMLAEADFKKLRALNARGINLVQDDNQYIDSDYDIHAKRFGAKRHVEKLILQSNLDQNSDDLIEVPHKDMKYSSPIQAAALQKKMIEAQAKTPQFQLNETGTTADKQMLNRRFGFEKQMEHILRQANLVQSNVEIKTITPFRAQASVSPKQAGALQHHQQLDTYTVVSRAFETSGATPGARDLLSSKFGIQRHIEKIVRQAKLMQPDVAPANFPHHNTINAKVATFAMADTYHALSDSNLQMRKYGFENHIKQYVQQAQLAHAVIATEVVQKVKEVNPKAVSKAALKVQRFAAASTGHAVNKLKPGITANTIKKEGVQAKVAILPTIVTEPDNKQQDLSAADALPDSVSGASSSSAVLIKQGSYTPATPVPVKAAARKVVAAVKPKKEIFVPKVVSLDDLKFTKAVRSVTAAHATPHHAVGPNAQQKLAMQTARNAHERVMENIERQLAVETAPVARRVIKPVEVEPLRQEYAKRQEPVERHQDYVSDDEGMDIEPREPSRTQHANSKSQKETHDLLKDKPFGDGNFAALESEPADFDDNSQLSQGEGISDFNQMMQD
jgi:hypothetical protein